MAKTRTTRQSKIVSRATGRYAATSLDPLSLFVQGPRLWAWIYRERCVGLYV